VVGKLMSNSSLMFSAAKTFFTAKRLLLSFRYKLAFTAKGYAH
jgi:hypothetical protein